MGKHVKITEIQHGVLLEMQGTSQPTFRPRSTLERLTKKQFVVGDKHKGWVLTEKARKWLEA